MRGSPVFGSLNGTLIVSHTHLTVYQQQSHAPLLQFIGEVRRGDQTQIRFSVSK